ncbi:hypothetical protein BVRB_5g120800 [Beta vulgaris subsp. vulgaris]|uniref:transcriptional regulator TAC1 n=1 Tax=Beta vulgaris subsp. vulgaris TaxID=3555 RepID=UPI00053F5F79|nr:transcriptional regulator TAC1 [Beta vulgaris subsp. vulgaris]KMT10330.1 hypothetical protein BVRB_5g120800 [Beta vulgaris subsp. vulgaris]
MDINGGSTGIRSYDCVFCQRGFTTAQALGGHMNIHRKDRVNPTTTIINKPNISPSINKEHSNNTLLSNKDMLLEEDNHHVDDNDDDDDATRLSKNHHSNGGSSSFTGRFHRFLGSEKWPGDRNPVSRRGGSGHVLEKRVQDQDHSKEGEELDLELRLGHYSW